MRLFARESDAAVEVLRTKLDAFYNATAEYAAFREPSSMPQQWEYVRRMTAEVVERSGHCRVLEVGAGMTGFARSLGPIRSSVSFSVQDVTGQNEEYLKAEADEVFIGDVNSLSATYDVIFSTFVLEHVSQPARTLKHLVNLLPPGGTLFVFCPRYDMPGYISRSADHYSRARRLAIALYVLGRRLHTLATGNPAFLIHIDPALFHLPWERDRDAIHWPSGFDIRALLSRFGIVRYLKLRSGGLKDYIVKNWLQLNVQFVKAPVDSNT